MARRKTTAAGQPVTLFSRTHARCREGMHLWCPGTVGRNRRQACLCECHKGVATKLRAAR
jgi:hypothetical protein